MYIICIFKSLRKNKKETGQTKYCRNIGIDNKSGVKHYKIAQPYMQPTSSKLSKFLLLNPF